MEVGNSVNKEKVIIRLKKLNILSLFLFIIPIILFTIFLISTNNWNVGKYIVFYFSIILVFLLVLVILSSFYERIEIDDEKIIYKRLWKNYVFYWNNIEIIRPIVISEFKIIKAGGEYFYKFYLKKQYGVKLNIENHSLPSFKKRLGIILNTLNMMPHEFDNLLDYYEWLYENLNDWFILIEIPVTYIKTYFQSKLQIVSQYNSPFDENKFKEFLLKFGQDKCSKIDEILDLSYESFISNKGSRKEIL
jgi:hypothetical protein